MKISENAISEIVHKICNN